MKKKLFVLFFLFCLVGAFSQAKYIWKNYAQEERQSFAYFRNDLLVEDEIDSAIIHLFADSRYQLFVNGQFVNFGPSRFYSRNPRYDSYDISPWLKKGMNTLAVKALSNGVYTFQLEKHNPCFIAWGAVYFKKSKHIFETPGTWKCKDLNAYNSNMPKISFALHIVESYDARKDDYDWKNPEVSAANWEKPVVLKQQNAWGSLTPRVIPHLTSDMIFPKSLFASYEFKNDMQLYSFRVNVPDTNHLIFNKKHRCFAYTYIYSPVKQDIVAKGWWGEYWLNGKEVKYEQIENGIKFRKLFLSLEPGWNYFFVKHDAIWGSWESYWSFPKDKGIRISADKANDQLAFYSCGPFDMKDEDKIKNKILPFQPTDIDKPYRWIAQYASNSAGNPCWEIVLNELGNSMLLPQHSLFNISLQKEAALFYDMGEKQLGRFFIDIEAPAGTTVDVSFSEDTIEGRPWTLKRYGLNMGARFIAKQGLNHFETFNPYGCRFIHINIMNNNGNSYKIIRTGINSQVYPHINQGSFQCSDPIFNRLWQMGYRTLQVCSEDSYTDTPFRERGLYAGDALPEFATTMVTSGDPRLMKQSLLLFQDMYYDWFHANDDWYKKEKNGKEMLDFIYITTLYFDWYIKSSGDNDFGRKYFPAYLSMLNKSEKHFKQENGLLFQHHVFIEWSGIKKDDYCSTFANAIYARACELMSDLALRYGYNEDAVILRSRSQRIVSSLNSLCWDEEKGAFSDGLDKEKSLNSYYPISSGVMSLFGYTNDAQEIKLKKFYQNELQDIGADFRDGKSTPYSAFYVLGGLYRNGNAAIAEMFIRKYYGMMVYRHNDTMWEDFIAENDVTTHSTLSHAWSSAPTFYFSSVVLGVPVGFPTNSNDTLIIIQPQSEFLEWAKGYVPFKDGKIFVSWRISGDILFYRVEVPKNVKYEFKPIGRLSKYKFIPEN